MKLALVLTALVAVAVAAPASNAVRDVDTVDAVDAPELCIHIRGRPPLSPAIHIQSLTCLRLRRSLEPLDQGMRAGGPRQGQEPARGRRLPQGGARCVDFGGTSPFPVTFIWSSVANRVARRLQELYVGGGGEQKTSSLVSVPVLFPLCSSPFLAHDIISSLVIVCVVYVLSNNTRNKSKLHLSSCNPSQPLVLSCCCCCLSFFMRINRWDGCFSLECVSFSVPFS